MSKTTNKFAPDVHVRLPAQLVVDRLERAANLLVSDGYDHSGQRSDVAGCNGSMGHPLFAHHQG